jgi:aspartyl-tRNA(Asn)/glutamyl-tRNA(Gln) amidotransferase subunit B
MTVTDTLVPYPEAVERYEPLMGLETHVELGTRTKMFCGCATTFGEEPNSQVCPVCLGLPGSLPVVNRMAIEHAIRIGLALNCEIASWCRFARKNYFYPDMPKNFQISQYDEPLCTDGWLDVTVDGGTVRVGIERVHLEEDTGKSLHVGGATGRIHGADHSLVDYNRAGIPLVEIVTKPIAGTGANAPEVARIYVTELRDLLRSLGVSDVRMEEGSLRCDVNTSLSPRGSGVWGTRTETKNVNSLRSVERAVYFEIERQAAVLDAGGRIKQETRHFHEDTGTTTPGRSKEEAQDYRYFPEPDLVPVAPSRDWVEQIRAALPQTPAELRRVRAEQRIAWNVSEADMTALENAGALDRVAETVAAGASPADASKWWLGELARRANDAGIEVADLDITPAQVARIAQLVSTGTLNDRLARDVIDGVLASHGGPDEVVAARGLAVVSDEDALTAAVDEAIAAHPDVAAKIRDGKVTAAGVLVGAVMKATRGQADGTRVRELIRLNPHPEDATPKVPRRPLPCDRSLVSTPRRGADAGGSVAPWTPKKGPNGTSTPFGGSGGSGGGERGRFGRRGRTGAGALGILRVRSRGAATGCGPPRSVWFVHEGRLLGQEAAWWQ